MEFRTPKDGDYALGWDFAEGKCRTAWWQCAILEDGSVEWTPLDPKEVYLPRQIENRTRIVPCVWHDRSHVITNLKPKTKPWTQFNSKPSWLKERK